jgi:hypothetical protein
MNGRLSRMPPRDLREGYLALPSRMDGPFIRGASSGLRAGFPGLPSCLSLRVNGPFTLSARLRAPRTSPSTAACPAWTDRSPERSAPGTTGLPGRLTSALSPQPSALSPQSRSRAGSGERSGHALLVSQPDPSARVNGPFTRQGVPGRRSRPGVNGPFTHRKARRPPRNSDTPKQRQGPPPEGKWALSAKRWPGSPDERDPPNHNVLGTTDKNYGVKASATL